MKEKKRNDVFVVIFGATITLVSLYISLSATAFANILHLDYIQVLYDPKYFIQSLNPTIILQGSTPESISISLFVSFIVGACMAVFYLEGNRLPDYVSDGSHGTAKWLFNTVENTSTICTKNAQKAYVKDMMDADKYEHNIMFDNTYGISTNCRKTQRNLHAVVIGGSGTGKTRYFVKPNILQMNSSYIITDPSGELYRDMADMLKKNNYDIRVFNTLEINHSMQYNPLSYLKKDEEVAGLVDILIKNTGEATGDNKYFDDATKLLLQAIISFLVKYCPESERDFSHVMRLVVAADVNENQKNAQSDLDKIFEQVEKIDPYGLPLKMYKSFKTTAGKTLKAVLSSTATRLTVFNYDSIDRLTCADTISLDTIGDEKTALFIITPPLDNGFNFLVSMMYSQLFSALYRRYGFESRYVLTDNDYIARPFVTKEDAEYVKKIIDIQKVQQKELVKYEYDIMTEKYKMIEIDTGKVLLERLREETVQRFKNAPEQFFVKQNTKEEAGSPFHIRFLMDEFANINEIPNFVQVLSTARKYNISIVIILQALSQLKEKYEKTHATVMSNCDTLVFLGTQDQETLEYVSKKLGFTTITVKNENYTKGKSGGSDGTGKQKRELMLPEEIGMMDNKHQIVMLRGVHSMKLKKYDLEKHPNFKQCADGDGQKMNLHMEVDLERKFSEISKLEKKEKEQYESQERINEMAQQPLNIWLNGKPFEKQQITKAEDEFFF